MYRPRLIFALVGVLLCASCASEGESDASVDSPTTAQPTSTTASASLTTTTTTSTTTLPEPGVRAVTTPDARTIIRRGPSTETDEVTLLEANTPVWVTCAVQGEEVSIAANGRTSATWFHTWGPVFGYVAGALVEGTPTLPVCTEPDLTSVGDRPSDVALEFVRRIIAGSGYEELINNITYLSPPYEELNVGGFASRPLIAEIQSLGFFGAGDLVVQPGELPAGSYSDVSLGPGCYVPGDITADCVVESADGEFLLRVFLTNSSWGTSAVGSIESIDLFAAQEAKDFVLQSLNNGTPIDAGIMAPGVEADLREFQDFHGDWSWGWSCESDSRLSIYTTAPPATEAYCSQPVGEVSVVLFLARVDGAWTIIGSVEPTDLIGAQETREFVLQSLNNGTPIDAGIMAPGVEEDLREFQDLHGDWSWQERYGPFDSRTCTDAFHSPLSRFIDVPPPTEILCFQHAGEWGLMLFLTRVDEVWTSIGSESLGEMVEGETG